MTTPVVSIQGLFSPGSAFAAPAAPVMGDGPEDVGMSDADRLTRGLDELKKDMYEESLATLQQVDASKLDDAQKKQLDDALASADEGATGRKAARASFEQGQAALTANDPSGAMKHYEEAAGNKFSDEGTRNKAREQMAVAEAAQKGTKTDMKALYTAAVADFRAGRYDEARAKFSTLREGKFSAPLFQKSPGDYLKEIDKATAKTAANTDGGDVAATDTGATDNAAPADVKPVVAGDADPSSLPAEQQPKAYYELARQQYASNNWDDARANFKKAQELNYKPELYQDSPAKYIERMDRRAAVVAAAGNDTAKTGTDQTTTTPPATGGTDTTTTPPAVVTTDSGTGTAPETTGTDTGTTGGTGTEMGTGTDTTVTTPPTGSNTQAELEETARIERIRRQQAAYEAQQLVTQAQAAATSDKGRALELYTQAAQLDPSNQQAQAGMNEMMALTGRSPGNSLSEQEKIINARMGAITYQFNQSLENAEKQIAANDFVAAHNSVQSAAVAADQGKTLFPPNRLSEFNTRLRDTTARLTSGEAAYNEAAARKANDEARRHIEEAHRVEEQQRRGTIASLIHNSRQLVAETKYNEALGVLDQILVLDPGNDYAIGVKPLVEDRALIHEQRQYREDAQRQMTRQLNSAEEKKIPYDDILRFPNNWPDISELRDQTVASEAGINQEDVAVVNSLERRLPEIRFEAASFSDVIDFLRDVSGSNIFVNWRALEAAGVDRNAPVTARLRDVKFSKALSTILSDVGGGDIKLSYTIDEGVITISTAEDLSSNVVMNVYDIRDLIINVPDFEAPKLDLQASSSGSGGGGGGGGGGLFGGGDEDTDKADQPDRAELVEQIIQLITETVAPDSWREAGGTVGAIRELSGQLIVTQTPENQRELRGLLEKLRETRAIQVTIEARFLTVQRNFLEDIGVDADFVFNLNGVNSSKFSPISVTQDTIGFTHNPDTGVPGSIGGGSGASTLSGLNVTGSFLDDFSVSFLIRATQASQSNTLLTAPRVTLFNGQRAFVSVGTERAYVSDLTPVVAENAALFDPTVSVVPQSMVVLDVQATVSSDRKYVTLTLQPTLSNLLELARFPVSAVLNNNTGNNDNDSDGDGIPNNTDPDDDNDGIPDAQDDTNDNIQIAEGFLQLPVLQVTRVRTTVSVPDGGTLLLGGQTLAGEINKEAGTPVLSKVPFLKRLFTNTSYAKDEQVLLILVKPTIIIQREVEQRQFPLLSTKVSQ